MSLEDSPTMASSIPVVMPLLRHTPPVKRSRVQLSCANCRAGKLKCDRQSPCQQCIKREKISQCTYPQLVPRKKPTVSLQKRLQHLESLVKDVMAHQISVPAMNEDENDHAELSPESPRDFQATPSMESSSNGELSKSPSHGTTATAGSILQSSRETAYVGATHWAAILDDIEEVKSYFDEDHEDQPTKDLSRPDLIFQSRSQLTPEELFAALPPKHVVDKQIQSYFLSLFPSKNIIHKPTFQKQYKEFWIDPSAGSLGFLALLYVLMAHATFAALGKGEDNPDKRGSHLEMIEAYRKWATQCLILSNYTQPGAHIIEALIIYMEGEFSTGNQIGCYLLVAVVLRITLRSGLHRDATKVTGNISVFHGEMRRRCWQFLRQVDLLSSFHVGLPSMTQSIECDTEYPRNLRDDDFNEDSIELPLSRPESEMTSMSYFLCKGRLMDIFGQVAAQANRLTLPTFDEVLVLDDALNAAFDRVPAFYRVVPLELAFTDSPEVIIQRYSIAVLYYKSRCVLHRKNMLHADDQRCGFSKQASIDASMQLLRFQSTIHDAVQSDGILSRETWFVNSLSIHDFLLAAAIIYLTVVQATKETSDDDFAFVLDQHQEMISLLERSNVVWRETNAMMNDAKKASAILDMMVKKVKLAVRAGKELALEFNFAKSPISQLSITEQAVLPDVTFGYESSMPIFPTQLQHSSTHSDFEVLSQYPATFPEHPIGNMLDMPLQFDWAMFDSHLRPEQHIVADQSFEFAIPDFESSYENNNFAL